MKNVSLTEWFNSGKEKVNDKYIKGTVTLELKQEAVSLVQAGQSIAAAAKTLGVSRLDHFWFGQPSPCSVSEDVQPPGRFAH